MDRTACKRVLVIEDDPEFLQVMSLALKAAGYQVTGAPDGEAGLSAYRRTPADLVVIDMITPVRDGVETIVALRRQEDPVRILAISGGFATGPEYYLVLARHLGADAALAKPFSLAEFVETVGQLLDGPSRSTPADLSPDQIAATYDLAERLDDAVIIARLMLARLGAPDDEAA